MTGPPTLADLMADPGDLDVTCLDCHRNTTMPEAALRLPVPAAFRRLLSGPIAMLSRLELHTPTCIDSTRIRFVNGLLILLCHRLLRNAIFTKQINRLATCARKY